MRGIARNPELDKRRRAASRVPPQAAPSYPVAVEVMFKDADAPEVVRGWTVWEDARFIRVKVSATEVHCISLDTVQWMRILGMPVEETKSIPAPSLGLVAVDKAPSGPKEYVVKDEAQRQIVPTARHQPLSVEGGGTIPGAVIVNPDGSTEVVAAGMMG